MTVYIFDEQKRVRKIIPQNGVISLIHDEANFQLHAEISMSMHVKNGEHLGFMCVDNRFRIFTVVLSEDFDDRGVTILTATDAIVQELKETIVENCTQTTTVKSAITALLRSAGVLDAWTIRGEDSEETKETKAYFSTAWSVMDQCMGLYLWQIIPYYVFEGNKITGRVIELAKDEAVFRGRILTSRKDANNVYIIRTDPPVTRLYATGGSAGTGDMQTSVTFSSVSWYKTNGNPADKPAGQAYVDDPEAIQKHGLHAAVLQLQHIQSPEELLRETWKELQKRKEPRCTVEANVSDMEQVQGYQRQIIRMGDKVPIRLSNATMETARVINVKRDYIRPWTTKIVLGEKVQTIQTQVAQMESGMSGFESVQDHTKQEVQKQQQLISALDTELKLEAAVIQLNAEMIQANAHVIELNAEQIRANAEQIALCAGKEEVTELGQTVTAAMVAIDGINAEVAAKATKAEINETNSRLNLAEIRLMGAESAISFKAERTEVTALGEEINEKITAAEIKIDGANSRVDILAEEIRLAGYVKAGEFEAETLRIVGDYMSAMGDVDLGNVVAASVNTSWLSADSIGADSIAAGALTLGGSTVSTSSLIMGSVASATIFGSQDVNLSHSHAVTVSGGVVTLGEVSSTGGSFNIADTQFYKDGVSAAKESVTLTDMGWQGGVCTVKASNDKTLAVKLPSFSVSGGDTFTGNKTTVYFSTPSVSGYLKSKEVDATSVYNSGVTAGKSDVTITAAGWVGSTNVVSASNGKSVNVTLPTFSTSGGTSFNSSHQTTVYFSTPSVNGALASKTVDASGVYSSGVTNGKDAVTLTSAGWVGSTNVVSASNGKSVNVTLPTFSASGGTSFNSSHQTTVYFSTPSVSGALASKTVDASDVYSSGVANGKDAVTLTSAGWVGSTNVVSASNGKSVNVTLPTFSTSGGTSFNSSHQTTVYFSTPSVSGALASKTVDASNVYALGYTEGSESVDTEEYYKDGYSDGYDVGYTEGVDSVNTTEYYNSGWNDCRDACDLVTAYTISQNSPGTLYVKVGDYYSSVGSSWVQVSRLYGVYTIPSAKQ